jgi:hypothetical protein
MLYLRGGRFTKDEFIITCQHNRISHSNAARILIESKWSSFLAANPQSFDGPLFRVDNYKILKKKNEINQIELYLSDTDYKEFVATRDSDFIASFGQDKTACPLSVGSVLVTNDNKLVFGKRSSKIDAEKDRISVVAGYLDPRKDFVCRPDSDSETCKIDIFYGVRREILEETDIQPINIVDLYPIGLIDNKENHSMNIPFYARLNISAEEIVRKRKKLADTEFSELIFIENSEQSINDLITRTVDIFSDIIIPILQIYKSLL